MDCYVITLKDNESSIESAGKTAESFYSLGYNQELIPFEAVTPEHVPEYMFQLDLEWTYPWVEERIDFPTKLRLVPYETQDSRKRVACALSHYLLWEKCVKENRNFLILEHDVLFQRLVDLDWLARWDYGIISLNDPRGATRRSANYHNHIVTEFTKMNENYKAKERYPLIVRSPKRVDEKALVELPCGLPGNSAYIICPWAASHMIDLVKEHGLWPNDAIMCNQLLPEDTLGCVYPYTTTIQQGLTSSTTK